MSSESEPIAGIPSSASELALSMFEMPAQLNLSTKPVCSPFDEQMGEYRLAVEDFRWHQLTDGPFEGDWTRGLWGGEMYQERRSCVAGRADDMLTTTVLKLPPSLALDQFAALFRLTWIRARFEHPSIAMTIHTDMLPISVLPSLVYHPVPSFADVSAWADTSFVLHVPDTYEECALNLSARVERLRKQLIQWELPVNQCAKYMHIVFSDRAEDQQRIAIIVHSAHTISDAHSEMMVLRKQLGWLAEYVALPYPLPETDPLHPANLAWGEEMTRLPPCLHELLGVDIDVFDEDKAVQTSGKAFLGHSLRLDLGRPIGNGLCDTMRTSMVFSVEETKSIQRACKAKSYTMTQIVDAARHLAYIDARRGYLENVPFIYETLHTNFLMPIDMRHMFIDAYDKYNFAGNATGGFTTIMGLREPYFVPASKERLTHFWRHTRDLDQVRVLCKVTDMLVPRYRDSASEMQDVLEGLTALLVKGGLLSQDYPWTQLAPEGFSSVGVVERTLPHAYPLPGHKVPITVQDWDIALTMSRHVSSLQFSFHIL
ncbi:hypothetical protein MVES_000715 [Malassezia vespertilionis]|uniref:Condensation domain-containing protein n=1 Tax=Malassezia vespertilionis TaxID=2020962 RepID=A0A2N1JGF9_9BASI|nr:hypothetical protein MVES_000715 [Malassezia vespertilionis]